jgi:hypothetical protein
MAINIPAIFPMSPTAFTNTLDLYLDLHRSYLFRVMFFDGNISSIAGGILTTNLIATTATPVSRTESIKLGWGGSNIKIAGKSEVQDWKVTIRDDYMNVAYTYLQSWRDAVYNFKKGTSNKINSNILTATVGYKKSAIIIMLGNATAAGPIISDALSSRAYLLHGVWPMEIGEMALDYSSETIATLPITFSMDYFEEYSLTSALASVL